MLYLQKRLVKTLRISWEGIKKMSAIPTWPDSKENLSRPWLEWLDFIKQINYTVTKLNLKVRTQSIWFTFPFLSPPPHPLVIFCCPIIFKQMIWLGTASSSHRMAQVVSIPLKLALPLSHPAAPLSLCLMADWHVANLSWYSMAVLAEKNICLH